MKKIIKFLIHLTSIAAVVSSATLNISQLAAVGQPNLDLPPGQPPTEPGGPRFIQPTEEIDDLPAGTVRSLRGGCASRSQLSLTALVPKNKIARTVSDYPTFFFYLPQTEAELAEFILEDESGNQIYQQDLTIKNLSGVIGLSIPANTNVPPLEVGKNYTWKFTVVCDPDDRSSDQSTLR